MSALSGFLLVTLLASAAYASLPSECLNQFGGEDKLVGKKVVEDGKRLTRNYIPFDQNASEIYESKLNGRYRIVHPGQPLTMDYVVSRVNINVDDGNVVTSANCG